MNLQDFSYFPPDELIAQHPRPQRDASRMMMLHRKAEKIENSQFSSLPEYLEQGDVLVINDSRVIPARIYGKKPTGPILEILLLTCKEKKDGSELWEVLARPGKRLNENDTIDLGHSCEAKVIARLSDKKWLMAFNAQDGFENYLERFGRAPLPPYIKRRKSLTPDQTDDRQRYQTIYAKTAGSIAAPTAGLHFSSTPSMLYSLKAFRLRRLHCMSVSAPFYRSKPKPLKITSCKRNFLKSAAWRLKKSIMPNGSLPWAQLPPATLESVADKNGYIAPQSGETFLYIYPGYSFKRVNGLLTNFHLPQSSLFLLVSAFAGTDFIKEAYARAVENRYLFYSYGDCMLIL